MGTQCPKCKVDISAVFVISRYTQIGQLSGNKVVQYEDVDNPIGSTIKVECSECDTDITKHIET